MLLSEEGQCGIRTGGSFRIVGGKPAMPYSWPWQVDISFQDINTRYISNILETQWDLIHVK